MLRLSRSAPGAARSRRGASAIEFALTASALFVFLFGIMDWGWFFFRRSEFMDAVLDATRRAVTLSQTGSPTPVSAAQTYARDNLVAYGLDAAALTITASYSGTSPSRVLVVSASMPYTPLIGLWPAPDTINAQMSMYLELQQ